MGLKAKRLKGLRIDENSGVGSPAHLGPGWLVVKSEDGGQGADEVDAEIEALAKALAEKEEPVADAKQLSDLLTKAKDGLPDAAKALLDPFVAALDGKQGEDPVAKAAAAQAAAEQRATAAEADAARLRKALAGDEPKEPDALAKAMESWPEEVRKAWAERDAQLTQAREDVVKERDARLSREYLEKARSHEFEGLAAKPEELATVLREADEKLTKEASAEFVRVLKSAAELAKNPAAFRSVGDGGHDVTSDREAALKAKAQELQSADPKLSPAEAITKAADLLSYDVTKGA